MFLRPDHNIFCGKRKKKNAGRWEKKKSVLFQSTPLNIYQDHVWHFSYLLVKITEGERSEMTARKEEKDAFIRACWRRRDGPASQPGPACNQHQPGDDILDGGAGIKITTLLVGAEHISTPPPPPPTHPSTHPPIHCHYPTVGENCPSRDKP